MPRALRAFDSSVCMRADIVVVIWKKKSGLARSFHPIGEDVSVRVKRENSLAYD